MAFFVRDGGSWKEVLSGGFAVRDGGTWKDVKEAWVRDGGTWKSFYVAAVVAFQGTGHTTSNTANPTYAGSTFASTGDEYTWNVLTGNALGTNIGTWLLSGAASDYWIRATLNSGTLDGSSSATGAWLAMSSNRFWGVSDSTTLGGPVTAQVLLEIATDSGGSTVVASQTYNFSAERTT